MGNAKLPYEGAGYGGNLVPISGARVWRDDSYKGILWDAEESPYFKGVEMSDARKSGDIKVLEVWDLKLRLESDIRKLLWNFEGATGLNVKSVYVHRNREVGNLGGELVSVDVEAVV